VNGRTPTIVVSGYASVDYAMRLAPFEGQNATTIVRSRADEWPRYGGVAHVTRAVAAAAGAGARAVMLSWVGPDAEGAAWSESVRSGGAAISGVAVSGSRTPSSHLLYPEGSGTICLFDPADCHPEKLTPAQRAVVDGADVVIATVGPAAPTRELIDALPAGCALVWTLKNDPSSLPEELTRRLSERSQLITLSDEESRHLETIALTARPGTYVARTSGPQGAELLRVVDAGALEAIGRVPATRVIGVDTTGAGDTFAGSLAVGLAAAPEPDPQRMLGLIAAAVEAATNMLAARAGAVHDEPRNPHQEEE